jgi:hypothetical protein
MSEACSSVTGSSHRGDSLAGRYESKARFDLRADGAGYRRTFEPSRWVWDEARLWTAGEVRAEILSGRWRLVRRLVA